MFLGGEDREQHVLLKAERGYPFTLQQGSVADLLAGMSNANHDLRGHAERVCSLSLAVAVRFGLSGRRLLYLQLAALLHDVGKLDVPPHILDKPGMLSFQETLVIHDHSLRGEQILRSLSLPPPICQAVRAHHERFDGRGYPDGLVGKEIPLEARILQVADAYDAMKEDRPYRSALTQEAARSWIAGLSGLYFDPEVVDCFLRAETV
jgi:putative nucleotidyltransferase with HDIG domain